MVILHPVFTLAFLAIIVFSFYEINGDKRYSKAVMIFLGIFLILLSGLRKNVGADYPVYAEMYSIYFPFHINYADLFPKMLLKESNIEMEWLYIALNKIVFELSGGGPFFLFTFVAAIILISVKFNVLYKNSEAPVFAILFYFIPAYFIADCGHIRQALGMTVLFFSFKYIKERKLWWYLLCMYIAFGFHKSTIIFLPAYWFATINLNARKITYLILISIVLSPFQIYEGFSFFLNSLSVQDISAGYKGYISYEMDNSGTIKFNDILTLFYAIMILIYDKEACKKILYYEYMRNIAVLGICIYFIMRENPVFSTRLIGGYFLFMTVVMSNIFVSISNLNSRKILHFGYIGFIIFYYFVFAKYQGNSNGFTPERYNNYLWSI